VYLRAFLTVVVIGCSATATADEVGKLKDMARASDDHRELTIDCLIEMKLKKAKGWETKPCKQYQLFATNELQVFRSEIKVATKAFTAYSKSEEASKRRVRRGLKQLFFIQENMKSIRSLSAEIKAASKKQ